MLIKAWLPFDKYKYDSAVSYKTISRVENVLETHLTCIFSWVHLTTKCILCAPRDHALTAFYLHHVKQVHLMETLPEWEIRILFLSGFDHIHMKTVRNLANVAHSYVVCQRCYNRDISL